MEKRRDNIKPIIDFNNEILFVGINPVEGSFKNDEYHYFSNNSYFYTLLKEVGFTEEKIKDIELPKYNYGIINYCSSIAKTPDKITKEEWKKAEIEFEKLLFKYTPKNIVFLGKLVPEKFFNIKVEFAKKYEGVVKCLNWFVVPFPTSIMKKEEKIKLYKEVLNQLE